MGIAAVFIRRPRLAFVVSAIMTIAGISYLGFGIQPPTPEWGLMISEGAAYMTSGEWWVSFFPGIAILSIVAALMLIDDGLKADQ